jgi:hypothetical protein
MSYQCKICKQTFMCTAAIELLEQVNCALVFSFILVVLGTTKRILLGGQDLLPGLQLQSYWFLLHSNGQHWLCVVS